MIKAVINTQKYFQAPKNYFWRWGEQGNVIEWKDGLTIAYRDELIFILKRVSNYGLPSLGTILLLLTACRDNYDESRVMGTLWGMLNTIPEAEGDPSQEVLEYHLHQAQKFLHTVSGIRKELKRRQRSMHLLDTVFEQPDFRISSSNLGDAVDELDSGRLDSLIIAEGEAITRRRFKADLTSLGTAAQKYPTTESLELRLSTGLDALPTPAEMPVPEPSSADLLDQLSKDPQTEGIARLAKRIMAALSIPMHSQGSGDHSYGGITDITNRGSYDKLLLSELAQDDQLLTARLINNEALYLRREEPPDNPIRQRTLLIDTTLKMWGLPRVFALSAALACAQTTRHHELIEIYALGGEDYTEADLAVKAGVTRFLELLHPDLHCGKALEAAIAALPAEQQNEYIFITDEVSLSNPAFQASLAATRESLSFMITVSRDGNLQLYEYIKGKTRLLSKARLDLNELVFAPAANHQWPVAHGQPRTGEPFEPPAFIAQSSAPLLFPVVRVKMDDERLFRITQSSLLAINETQRVLYISEKKKAAYEVLNYIEKGSYAIGYDKLHDLYILVANYQRNLLKLYTIDLLSLKKVVMARDLSGLAQYPKSAIFSGIEVMIDCRDGSFLYNCKQQTIKGPGEHPYDRFSFARKEPVFSQSPRPPELNDLLHFDNSMFKVRQLYVLDQKLVIGNYTLEPRGFSKDIYIGENAAKKTGEAYSTEKGTLYRPFQNKAIKCAVRVWEDGSRAVIDSRGLLHLQSSDKTLPEITIVLTTGSPTACWASNGNVTGNARFINEKIAVMISPGEFYTNYIQPFIRRLV